MSNDSVAAERLGWSPANPPRRVRRLLFVLCFRAGSRGHHDERFRRDGEGLGRLTALDARRAVVYVLVLVRRAEGRVQGIRRLELGYG